jgi:hypothetical protein
VEAFGIILKKYITHIFRSFINPKENSIQVLSLLTQQLSVAVHTIRAIQFEAIKGVQVLRSAGSSQLLIGIGQVDRLSTKSLIIA